MLFSASVNFLPMLLIKLCAHLYCVAHATRSSYAGTPLEMLSMLSGRHDAMSRRCYVCLTSSLLSNFRSTTLRIAPHVLAFVRDILAPRVP